ncbi:MFS transporter [Luteipulveratus mongoliensis]|uniref:Transporter n=1 Tax=Luteipulveratus mongoliensis TaxID=571913 RepID=A0A0K1JN05_9MICO|nr:MFS transporter [Luteipulveratus mongoliensis]AKU17968.1 transporter [Luteipulveratus mongoliensis]
MTQTTTAPARSAPPNPASAVRPGLLLAVLLTAQFMVGLDLAIVNVAIPSIQSDLGATGSGLQLVLSGYVISYAVLLVTGARLGDRVGQRTMFTTGLIVFTATSLACGLAWSTSSLIAFRFLQGAGAAAMVPQVMTLIQVTFTGAARGKALARYAAVISGGAVVGQVLGGLIVTADILDTGWRGVFLVNVPIGLAALMIAPRVIPGGSARPGHRLDVKGLLLLSPAVLLIVLPLVLGHDQDWPAWTWVALAASVVVLAGFVVVERSVAAPLFPGRLMKAPGLVPAVACNTLVMATFAGTLFSTAIHMQGALGYSALHTGLLFVPMAVAFAIASMNWGKIPVRHHPGMIRLGLLLAAATLIAMGLLLRDGRDFGPVEIAVFTLNGFGYGFAMSPLMTTALSKVPLAEAADASGFMTTSVQLGNVIGVATFGTLFLTHLEEHVVHASAQAFGLTQIVEGVVIALAAALAIVATRPRAVPAVAQVQPEPAT